jgi:hypothetical protein
MLKLMLAAAALTAVVAIPVAPVHAVTLPQMEQPQNDVTKVGRRHSGRHFSGRHFSGRHHFGGHRFHRHRHHRHFRYGFVGAPIYYHGYYYRGGCGWLRRRALATGSPYWWHRYRACRYGW